MILLHLFFIPLRILDELEGMCSDWKHKPYDDPFLAFGLWFFFFFVTSHALDMFMTWYSAI